MGPSPDPTNTSFCPSGERANDSESLVEGVTISVRVSGGAAGGRGQNPPQPLIAS